MENCAGIKALQTVTFVFWQTKPEASLDVSRIKKIEAKKKVIFLGKMEHFMFFLKKNVP